jgi:hypothetical protein
VLDRRIVSAGFLLEVAGLGLAVTADADLPIAPEGTARKFVRPPGAGGPPPVARLHARWGDPQIPANAPIGFDSGGGLWRLYRTLAGPELVFTSLALGPEPYQSAAFSDDFTEGEVTLRREPFVDRLPLYPLHYPLDEVFMVHLLARGLGVELHAAGVVLPGGEGLLFVGQSGAGKSTLSRMWRTEPGVRVLSDERMIVRRHDDGVWMYGTPWHGDGYVAEPGRARLERVFLLRQAPENGLAAVAPVAAAARLFACAFVPFHDAAGLDFSLGLLTEIVGRCRCAELAFVPDRSVLDFVRA